MNRTPIAGVFGLMLVVSCGGEGTSHGRITNYALECDLGGIAAQLTLQIEVVDASGVARGIDRDVVIPTGDVTYYTSGEIRSPVALYIFTGTNQFADFTDTTTLERFRVQWVPIESGLTMVVNPFGPGPVQYTCTLR